MGASDGPGRAGPLPAPVHVQVVYRSGVQTVRFAILILPTPLCAP